MDIGGWLQAVGDTLFAAGVSVLNLLNQGWIGALLGIIGIVAAYYFYRRSQQGAQLAFQHQSTRVLGGRDRKLPADVKILFRDQAIENLCRTILVIWNHSDKTIYGANIVETDGVRIELPNATILDARVMARTREVNACSVDRPTETGIPLRFEYLDSSDGFVVELFHTEAAARPMLRGTVREMPRGFRDFGTLAPLSRASEIFSWFTLAFGVFLAAVFVFVLVEGIANKAVGQIIASIFFLLLGSLYGVAGVVGIFRARCKFPRVLLLPEFRSFSGALLPSALFGRDRR